MTILSYRNTGREAECKPLVVKLETNLNLIAALADAQEGFVPASPQPAAMSAPPQPASMSAPPHPAAMSAPIHPAVRGVSPLLQSSGAGSSKTGRRRSKGGISKSPLNPANNFKAPPHPVAVSAPRHPGSVSVPPHPVAVSAPAHPSAVSASTHQAAMSAPPERMMSPLSRNSGAGGSKTGRGRKGKGKSSIYQPHVAAVPAPPHPFAMSLPPHPPAVWAPPHPAAASFGQPPYVRGMPPLLRNSGAGRSKTGRGRRGRGESSKSPLNPANNFEG